MKEDDEICSQALAEIIRIIVREDPELYKQIVRAIPDSADYFRARWEENFGSIVDVAAFTDEEIIDATFAINRIKMSEAGKKDRIREVAKILRIKPNLFH